MSDDQATVYRVQSISGWTTCLQIDDPTMRRLESGHPEAQGQIAHLFSANIRQKDDLDPGWVPYSELEFEKLNPDS